MYKDQKFFLDKLNKKQAESFIQYGFFVIVIVLMLFAHSIFRWSHYHNNTQMSTWETEEKVSYDDVTNPDPGRKYFNKILVVKTIRAKTFPYVETTRIKTSMGLYSQEK